MRLHFVLATALLCGVPAIGGAEDPLASHLGAAAAALRSVLGEEALGDASFPFADAEREDVRYAPLLLEGAQYGDLDARARAKLDELLGLTLSPAGYAKVQRIRALESAVKQKESGRLFGAGSWFGSFRDPGRYFFALFGEPGAGAPWGYRYEGHHVSLNVTALPLGVPATTPLFLGAEPRVVDGVAALGEEEAAARALLAALPRALRERAALAYAGDRELMLGQVRRAALGEAAGVSRGESPAEARAQFDRLVSLFTSSFAPEIAAAREAEIDAAGRDALRFAWAEASEPPGAFYFRLQGPRTLIELDNTTDGDHVHAVWHDTRGDFGDDLLAAHLREAHGATLAEL